MQSLPDKDFKWILNYQDHFTKFSILRSLKSKKAEETAKELLDIFLQFGAPSILQSDNGREFTATIIKEVVSM
jgi:transposase InsO family protein